MTEISVKDSQTLYVIKAFAVLLVIGAHMSFTSQYPISEGIRMAICQVGVVVFMILSGFFYHREKNDSKIFWKKKFKRIIIPWLLIGTITFVLGILLSGLPENTVLAYVKWIIGSGTWYWYISVLLVLYVLFKFIPHNAFLYVLMGVSVISILLTQFNFIPYNKTFTYYLNPLNWVGFYALGICLKKYSLLNKLLKWYIIAPCIVIFVGGVVLFVASGQTDAYISGLSLIIEISGAVIMLFFAHVLHNSKLLQDIGKKSFLIYLSHMQIAGAINTRLPYNSFWFLLRPFIALSVVYLLAKVAEFVIKKFKMEKIAFIIGL